MKRLIIGAATLGLLGMASAGVALTTRAALEAKAEDVEKTTFYCVGEGFTYAHSWHADGETSTNSTEWPGETMTKVSDGLYKIDIDLSKKNRIIFNDGSGNQTGDLTLDSNFLYYQKGLGGIWSETLTPSAGYYLVGDFSNWGMAAANVMEFDADASIAYIRNKTISNSGAGNIKLKAIYNSGSSVTWYEPSNSKYHDLSIPGAGNVWNSGNDLGIYFGSAGSITADIAANISDGSAYYHFAQAATPMITIGDKAVAMSNYIQNFDEYSAVVSDVVAGSALSIEGKEVEPNSLPSNNLTEDKKVKVGGDVTVYYNKFERTTWVTGYSAGTTVIQNFCDSLLALGCDATSEQLAALDWDGEGVKAAMNGATVSLGDDKTYTDWGNVVNEAATRYANLVSNGLSPVEGVTLAAGAIPAGNFETTTLDYVTPAVIIASFTTMTALIGTFFLLRRKHQN